MGEQLCAKTPSESHLSPVKDHFYEADFIPLSLPAPEVGEVFLSWAAIDHSNGHSHYGTCNACTLGLDLMGTHVE